MEIELLEDNIEALKAIQGDKLTVLRFTAKWCGPCRMIKPVFEQLTKENLDTTFISIDVDNLNDISVVYGVRSIPTIIVIDSGNNVLKSKTGATSQGEFQKMLDEAKQDLNKPTN